MRAAVVSHNARRFDAIGNHIAEKVAFFRDRQAEVRVFVESAQAVHSELNDVCHVIDETHDERKALAYLESCDVVFFEFGQAYALLNWLPYLAGKKPRLIFDYHCVTPPAMWSGRHRREMERASRQRKLAWCADAVWVHSLFAKRELRDATGLPDQMIHCIGFPVESSSCDGPGEGRVNDGRRTILFVGRLAPNKRIPVLIEALAILRDRTPPVYTVVVGDAGDVYADEKRKCLQLAETLGVSDRIEFRGQASPNELQQAYQSADVFVMPSIHEGFCIPVIEAMAHGVPVVAARAAALPETVGDAGLTFVPDDAHDLVRQIERVLDAPHSTASGRVYPGRTRREPVPPLAACDQKRVAVVACRFGDNVAGGAETSLRTMATVLRRDGHAVEIFTTCTASDSEWRNELPVGSSNVHGLTVHRFPIDDHDRASHLKSVEQIKRDDGRVSPVVADAYLRHSLHSSQLIDRLHQCEDELDAIISGPYLFGLTADVARAFPQKTLAATCFHDEPIAHLETWPTLYGNSGGILFHSENEKQLAQSVLGVNHPNSYVIGAFLDDEESVPRRDRLPVDGAYLVYCGRYSPEKELPRLLEYAKRYDEQFPGRFRFVFMGAGGVAIPKQRWAVDLGFASEQRKRAVLAGARALVQLSRNESLSLVALEAWREGVPVIADRRCEVLAGFIDDAGGGDAVEEFDEFAAILNNMWTNPEDWRQRGERGRQFVRSRFASGERYTDTLIDAVNGLAQPISELLRTRGRKRAAEFERSQMDAKFTSLLESTLEREPRDLRNRVAMQPQRERITSVPGQSLLVSLRVENRGTHALTGEGPGATCLETVIADVHRESTPFPGILAPGETTILTTSVTCPDALGEFELVFRVIQNDEPIPDPVSITVTTIDGCATNDDQFCRPFLDDIDEALVELHRKQELPTNYSDVTGGWLANWKQRVKQKLLNNFKRAYVDVLSQQQTEVNQHAMTALQRMAECCESLQNAVVTLERRVRELEGGAVDDGCKEPQNADGLRQRLSDGASPLRCDTPYE